MTIDFKVKRSEDCITIDTKAWITSSTIGITVHRMSGRDIPTYITKAVSVNPVTENLKGLINTGDTILLSRVASDISQYKKFAVKVGDDRYFNAPIMQILGVFNGDISLENLELLTDKILIEKIEAAADGIILSKDNTMVGRVLKTGTNRFDKEWNKYPLTVKQGDVVLVRDNVTTEIMLGSKRYYVTEEPMVVGIFKGDKYSLDSLQLLNNYIILDSYIKEQMGNLFTPIMDYEEADYTQIYDRDLFKVLKVSNELDNIRENDILLIDRNYTNYVYLGAKRYFVLSGTEYISARVNE